MIDFEYEYFYVVETQSYANGIASEKQKLQVVFDSNVDRSSSLMIYDGNVIDLNQEIVELDIQKEGITELIYILKDVDGYPLMQGQSTILLDTISPLIHVDVDGDVLYVDQEKTVHVRVDEDNVKKLSVYIDDVLISTEGYEFDLNIGLDVKNIRIECEDMAGHIGQREIRVQAICYPEIEAFSDVYWIEPTYSFGLSDPDFDVAVYRDGTFISNQSLDSITFDESGTYTFRLFYRDKPSFYKDISGKIIYSNVNPSIQLIPSSVSSNQDVNVDVITQGEMLSESYYEVNLNGQVSRYPLSQNILLSGLDGQELSYFVNAFISDLFGRVANDSLWIHIDKKAPSSQLYVNDSLYTGPMDITSKVDFRFECDDLKSVSRISYFINSNLVDLGVDEIFKRLVRNDVLMIQCIVSDAFGNCETRSYEFTYLPELPEKVSYQSIENIKQDEIKHQRVWSVNEQQEITLHEEEKVVVDITKPKLHIQKFDGFIRIWLEVGEAYSNDRFSYIKVNGNTIDLSNLKKDSTGQYYYDVSLGYRNLEIEAMAMDDAGNKALATKSFTGKFPWPIGIVAACFVCILKLLKHE